MASKTNRRNFTRVTVRLESEVKAGETTAIHGQLKDVSLNGMFILSAKTLPVGLDCRAVIVLQGETQQIRIETNGRVIRVHEDGIGIEFTAIHGAEGFAHLSNLVRYNAADVDQVEEELERQQGIKPIK